MTGKGKCRIHVLQVDKGWCLRMDAEIRYRRGLDDEAGRGFAECKLNDGREESFRYKKNSNDRRTILVLAATIGKGRA